ncbi:MAG TPA: FAD-binding oxidoreductase [Candidatus Acidoferrales bacterium]|nr:FAD-binding oxidoreductase [Candidatus Acidoferrales bacterium]
MATDITTELAETISGGVITPNTAGYEDARRVWNGLIDRRPLAIARCAGAADVAQAIRLARSAGLPLSVRGGGHNVAGSAVCDGGVVIDLSPLREVTVDAGAMRATVGGGALWSDVDQATQAHGQATTGGIISHTGVGGFTLGGGIGWLMRRYGLTCDNLVGAEVVTAAGDVVRADAHENADLLWALRGGGGNFGVVTRFEFELHPLSTVLVSLVMYAPRDARQVLTAYRQFVDDCPDELTTLVGFITAPPAPFVLAEVQGHPVVSVLACHCGDLAAAQAEVAPMNTFAEPVAQMTAPVPYAVLQTMFDDGAPHGLLAYWRTEYLGELSDAAIGVLTEHAARNPSPLGQVHIHHLEGAVARVAEGDTAFCRRYAPFVVNLPAGWMDPAENEQNIRWVREFSDALRPLGTGEAYTNFMGGDDLDRVRAAYGPNLERLIKVKRHWDPDNVFRANLNIRPG